MRFTSRKEATDLRTSILAGAEAIVNLAAAEKRGLTVDEKAQHDAALAQAKAINGALTDPANNTTAALGAAKGIPGLGRVPVSQLTATAVAQGTMPADPGIGGRFGGFSFAEYFAASQGRQSFAGGGVFVPEGVQPSLWPALLPMSVAIAAGIRVLPVSDNTMIPAIASQPEAAWVGEDTQIPPTSTGFSGHKITFRKLASRQIVENDLIRSADRDVSAMLLDEQSRALALTLDRAVFEADGTQHAILGLKSRTDIQGAAIATNGAVIANLDTFIVALGALETENARPTAWVMHPRTWSDLMKLRDQVDSLRPLLGEAYGASATAGISRRLLGLDVHLSSQLSITETEGTSGAVCASVYVGQWDQVVLARDATQQIYLDVDESELFSKDQTQLRALVRVDLAVPNPKAVYRLRGIKATV